MHIFTKLNKTLSNYCYALFLSFVVLMPADALELSGPFAATSSDQKITAKLPGIDISTLISVDTAETQTYATAVSGLNLHYAEASSELWIPGDRSAIATFFTNFNTSATASSDQPLFSKGATIGQSSVVTLLSPSPSASVLNLEWEFEAFNLVAEPSSSFAYVGDMVRIVQQTESQTAVTTLGFFTTLENGIQSSTYLELSGTNIIEAWFDKNTENFDNQIVLNADSPSLGVAVPLLDSLHQEWMLLSIENLHVEVSAEAPPAAARQVDEKIGYFGTEDDQDFQLHWDALERELSFDRLPINILTNGEAGEISERYFDDPLNGGFLEIDPFILIGDADEREFFTGQEMRLVDKDGNILYKASLPSIVFDDQLSSLQGYDLFAPILNVLEVNLDSSPWLQDYFSQAGFDSLLLPELFIGIDPLFPNRETDWENNFDAAVTSVLSFATVAPKNLPATVPEPGDFILILVSFVFIMRNVLLRRGRITSTIRPK